MFPQELLLLLFRRLHSPKDLAQCALVCRLWYAVANDDSLWSEWCERHAVPAFFQDTSAKQLCWRERDKERYGLWVDPNACRMDVSGKLITSNISELSNAPGPARSGAGAEASTVERRSPRRAFDKWQSTFCGFQQMFPRMYRLIFRLTQWLRVHSPVTLLALQTGRYAAKGGWQQLLVELYAEKIAKTAQLHLESIHPSWKAFLLFYYFYDGQRAKMPVVDYGLFGTMLCYGQYSSVFMLPSRAVEVQIVCGLRVAVFAVCARTGKYYALVQSVAPADGDKESLYVSRAEREALVHQVIELDENFGFYVEHGSFLEWIERYVDDLEAGNYNVMGAGAEKTISMFPNEGPFTSRATARGIQIEASSVLALEASAPTSMWIYRLKLRYVGGMDAPSSCQLTRRHWLIRYQSGAEEHVRGEGVVGENPILNADAPEFSYCSVCTGRDFAMPADDEEDSDETVLIRDPAVSMEGEMEFRVLRRNAVGDEEHEERFVVPVARFLLQQPKCLFIKDPRLLRPLSQQQDILEHVDARAIM